MYNKPNRRFGMTSQDIISNGITRLAQLIVLTTAIVIITSSVI